MNDPLTPAFQISFNAPAVNRLYEQNFTYPSRN
jgi:hypothetical protein